MKTTYTKLIILFITLFTSSVFADYIPETGIYVKESYELLAPNEIPRILERFEKETPEKNIIFYVHGRGKNTQKEWKALQNLENLYNARVIMFHWPSWVSLTVRPLSEAKKAAPLLSKSLKYVRDYKNSHPGVFANKKISLLTHSMGNVVFREFIEHYHTERLNDNEESPLFDTYISSGADVSFIDHRAWFSKIDFAREKFIIMNNRDLVLTLSYLLDLEQREPAFFKLGLGVRGFPIKTKSFYEMLEPNTTYIDLTGALSTQHRHFESEKPFMQQLFNSLLNGEGLHANELGLNVEHDRNIVYLSN